MRLRTPCSDKDMATGHILFSGSCMGTLFSVGRNVGVYPQQKMGGTLSHNATAFYINTYIFYTFIYRKIIIMILRLWVDEDAILRWGRWQRRQYPKYPRDPITTTKTTRRTESGLSLSPYTHNVLGSPPGSLFSPFDSLAGSHTMMEDNPRNLYLYIIGNIFNIHRIAQFLLL